MQLVFQSKIQNLENEGFVYLFLEEYFLNQTKIYELTLF